jgi:ketosteroid isomerase-like protein
MTAVVASQSNYANDPPSADAKQQVLDLGKEWGAAEVKHDGATLLRILDDKFIATFGTRKPYDKRAFIKAILDGDVDPTASQTLTDEIVIVDRDTAVVVGTDTVRGTEKGAPYVVVYRYTVTYVHRQGQWRALAEHLVEVPQTK